MRALLLLAGLVAAAPTGAAAPAIEAGAAWHGYSRPERPVEIRIALHDSGSGRARVDLTSTHDRITTQLALGPNGGGEVRLPLAAADDLEVRAELADGRVLTTRFQPTVIESPLVATALDVAVPDGFAAVAIDPGALPEQAVGYGSIDALVVDEATLAQLTARQLGALISHLKRCGRVVAIGLPPAAATLLQGAAGCSGLALALIASPGGTPDALAALFATPLPDAVPANALAALVPHATGPWSQVVLMLALYAAIALLAALFAPRPLAAVGLALIAAFAVIVAPRLLDPAARLGVWAEFDAGDRDARYGALESVPGTGRRALEIALPDVLVGAAPCAGSVPTPLRWTWDSQTGRYAAVEFEARLFRTETVCFNGDFPSTRGGALAAGADGLRAVNAGISPWPVGVALRAGRVYPVPPLPPGASTTLPPSAARDPRDADESLAVERTGSAGGVLWPLELPDLGLPRERAAAFLLLRTPLAGGS